MALGRAVGVLCRGFWLLFSCLGMKGPIHRAAAGLKFSSGLRRVPEPVLKAEGIMERLQPCCGASSDATKTLGKPLGLVDGSRRPGSQAALRQPRGGRGQLSFPWLAGTVDGGPGWEPPRLHNGWVLWSPGLWWSRCCSWAPAPAWTGPGSPLPAVWGSVPPGRGVCVLPAGPGPSLLSACQRSASVSTLINSSRRNMEKPGLEPPPPAFPNKGLIEAGPAPCHVGARCCPAAGAKLAWGAEGPQSSGLHGACWWAAAIREPPCILSAGGCRLGLLVLCRGGGHQLGATSNRNRELCPWHRAAVMAGKCTSDFC